MKRNKIIFTEGSFRITGENVWMTMYELTELFYTIEPVIRKVLVRLRKSGVIRECETSRYEQLDNGYEVEVYHLEAIIAIAFHIDTPRARLLRKWLTKKLAFNSHGAITVFVQTTAKMEN